VRSYGSLRGSPAQLRTCAYCDCYACSPLTRPLYLEDIAEGRIRLPRVTTGKGPA
jgi:hypothetical protein